MQNDECRMGRMQETFVILHSSFDIPASAGREHLRDVNGLQGLLLRGEEALEVH
jgi:hypothetical protein